MVRGPSRTGQIRHAASGEGLRGVVMRTTEFSSELYNSRSSGEKLRAAGSGRFHSSGVKGQNVSVQWIKFL